MSLPYWNLKFQCQIQIQRPQNPLYTIFLYPDSIFNIWQPFWFGHFDSSILNFTIPIPNSDSATPKTITYQVSFKSFENQKSYSIWSYMIHWQNWPDFCLNHIWYIRRWEWKGGEWKRGSRRGWGGEGADKRPSDGVAADLSLASRISAGVK